MAELQNYLRELSNEDCIPINHKNYLRHLKESGFEPKVIYDIGACVLHWTKFARTLWPEATIIVFDAFGPAEFLYKECDYDYHVGVLSGEDDNNVKFYQNDYNPGGNSYYRELGFDNGKYFPEDRYVEMMTKTLDSVVRERGFPTPDFVKIDVQGAEIDILQGAIQTMEKTERMIVELQHMEYNQGAKTVNESLPIIEKMGWNCDVPLFQNNGPDGDYSFVKASGGGAT